MAVTEHRQSTISDYVDEAARESPNDTWAIVSRSPTSIDEGWRHFTFADLARAVNGVAWWIEKEIGLPQEPGQTIAYMGANDLRYIVVLVATLKVGYVPLFTSPRNSLEGQKSLLEKTNCSIFLATVEMKKQLEVIQQAVPHLKVFQAPTTQELLDPKLPVSHYASRQDGDAGAHSAILHTSGSTGIPKPIHLTVAGINTLYALAQLEPEDGLEQSARLLFVDRRPMVAPVPFFHAMGVCIGLRSIIHRATIVRLPSERMLSADLVIEVINSVKPTFGVFPPSILEDISTTDVGLAALGQLENVFFGGAPLSAVSGDKISQVTNLVTMIGSTEALMLSTLLPTGSEDWDYFHWSSVTGAVMEPAEDGLFELVVKPKDKQYQAIFHTFPDISEWRTRDLFVQHPSKPYLWKYSGRRDDIIVLSNGEKLNPVSMEKAIESHSLVKGALVVGQAKFQAGLLIELDWSQADTQDTSALIDRIWPTVEEANQEAPTHARIYQSKIVIADAQKPFVRAGKGSIIRSQTVKSFKDEIEALYADEGYSSEMSPSTDDDAQLSSKVRDIFVRVLSYFQEDTADDVDIFSLGVDSLDVLSLTNTLNKSIRGANITPPTVYGNPSVKQLVKVLSQTVGDTGERPAAPLTREEKVDKMVKKYTHDMIRLKASPETPQQPPKHTIILTGSTGSLGSHMLEQLLNNPDVEKVYCMNRSANASTRQKTSFATHNHDMTHFDKASFLHTDFGKDRFGLDETTYAGLQDTVTLMIHNAWSVDFNLSLESYEATHIAGVRRTADFAASSKFKPTIVFISSVASVGGWAAVAPDGAAVPESTTSLFDATITLPQGYGESKYVGSQILAIASHRLGIKTAIVRAGQLAGPSTMSGGAAWNAHEWLPTLVHTSKILKKLPRALGTQDCVNWVPMDVAAGTVIDIATASGLEDTQVFHLLNPHTTSWSQVYPVIQTYYKELGLEIDVVEYDAWIDELKQIPVTKENAEKIAGLKLLDFYETLRPGTKVGLPTLETRRTEDVSKTLRESTEVNGEVMRKWLQQWAF